MAAQNPVQAEDVARKVFQVVVIGTVLFIALTLVLLL